jgi:membrane-associated protein
VFDFVFNLETLIKTASYFGLFAIVFAETGLLVGFFLPGDSLLITAGIVAAEGFVKLPWVMLACTVAALLGDSTGYWIGRKLGPMVFNRPENRFLDPRHIDRAKAYFDKYGAKTFIIARFIPVVRTITPTMAGVSRISYKTFLIYSLLASVIWGCGLPLAGFLLGKSIPDLEKYILFIIAGVILVSFIPVIREFLKHRQEKKAGLSNPSGVEIEK